MVRFVLGVMAGVILVPVAVYVWFSFGRMPVAVADPQLPHEQLITSIPLHARIQREAIGAAPIHADETNLVSGARVYIERCSICHGLHGKPSAIGADMFPVAPQLLETHGQRNIVGVSDDPAGETYWKVYNGIRLTGMPSFKDQLSETEMWQVSLFLAYADKPMPPAALQLLHNAPAPPTGKHTQPAPPEQPPLKSVHSPETPEDSEEPEQQ
jgi:mono/diheme cytochrome c family protein